MKFFEINQLIGIDHGEILVSKIIKVLSSGNIYSSSQVGAAAVY
jgi:hypothetical protein